jgi:glycosyltransferase involved in cell wall biosynthesis
MWNGKTVGVVIPTYRESATIRKVVTDFEALGIVDEIVVANNNAEEGTSEAIEGTSAHEVHVPLQGYGAAIQGGVAASTTDLVCVCEADGTFRAEDLIKLLAYTDTFDFVIGSRTVPDFIWDGANMGRFLRWGNWAVAKMMEGLFNTASLSDIGCTLRVVPGPLVRRMVSVFTVHDGAFGPQMMLFALIGDWRLVQIPVNYRARRGSRGTTDRPGPAITIGLQMIRLIAGHRLASAQWHARLAKTDCVNENAPSLPAPGGRPAHLFPRPWKKK